MQVRGYQEKKTENEAEETFEVVLRIYQIDDRIHITYPGSSQYVKQYK